ncbi:Uncharacterised protein [Mycobacteroides abscessus subsp. abscessus]|nr:Uncharacterised protein [Mycobacteroides abscessus subsp. abscessus]
MRRHAALKRVGIELSGHGYMPDSEIGGYVLHIYETSVQPLDPAYAVDFASLAESVNLFEAPSSGIY